MTEEMIVQLSALRPDRLGVIARTSAMHCRGTQKRVDPIARELAPPPREPGAELRP